MSRNISATKYMAVIATTSLIFVIGLVIGSIITSSKLSDINNMQQTLRTQTLAIELQYDLLEEEPCSSQTTAVEELFETGTKLDYMESSLGKDNPEVLQLKEYYSLIELKHWLFTEKLRKQCSRNTSSVAYFYSNAGDCDKCEEQGFILSYLHKKHPSLNIYSFDINMDNPALKTFKQQYDVKTTPTIILNKKTFNGFMNLTQLNSVIITS